MQIQEKLTVQLIQMAIHWHDARANCEQIAQRLQNQLKADIVVLPEMFNSGFSMQPDKVAETMDGYTVNWMREMATKLDSVMVGSVAIREANNCYNRMIWMPAEGEPVIYDKKHLFTLAGEDKSYAAGEKRVVVNFNGWRILLQVCYDLRFPVWCRQQSMDYDLMLLVANWPDARANAWNGLIPARAIENQCYVAAVNRVGEDARQLKYAGDSQLMDYLGSEMKHAGNEETILTVELSHAELLKSRIELPFHKDADPFYF